MNFIKGHFTQTLEVKKSKFIAHIVPYDQFNQMMEDLRKEHPKGRHFVYGYRYLNEFDQVVENCSDDGEPKGTSGKPTLNVLSGADMINCGVIIVRYFGGIKLGTGGLVKAYSDAVNLVLNICEIHSYVKLKTKYIIIDYSRLSQLEYIIKQYKIDIKHKDFSNNVTLTLESSKEEFLKLSNDLFIDCELMDEK